MTRTLVVYYSRSGKTQQMADDVAAGLGATLERIEAPGIGGGPLGYVKAALSAFGRRPVAIAAPRHDPADFDLVVVGSPVWIGGVSGPVRTYLTRYGNSFKRCAFFVTLGGGDAESAFADLAACSGRQPEAIAAISDRDRRESLSATATMAFLNRLLTCTPASPPRG